MNSKDTAVRFYQAFQAKDFTSMAECYSDHVVFSDPVFPHLKAQDAKDMWHMLCVTGKDLRIEFLVLDADLASPSQVKVRWDAWYLFSKTGRSVHNIILATLTIENGKIVRHIDDFSFWRWSAQALGLTGSLLGWTPLLRNAVRKTAAASLAKFQGRKT